MEDIMNRSHPLFTNVLTTLLTLITLFSNTSWIQAEVSATEKAALVALYDSTNGANWTNKTGWENSATTDPCEGNWHGVTCNANNTTVTKINLYSNNLKGTIPPEIGNLANLTELRLTYNSLSDAIPAEIGNLVNLTNLHLYANDLTGNIPPEIGNLVNVVDLRLSDNALAGDIPSQIGNLTKLTSLILNGNSLDGQIPAEIGKCTILKTLFLQDNNLTGPLPSTIGRLANMTHFYIYNNTLSGPIPASIGNLSQLVYFRFNSNQFCGRLPSTLMNLPLTDSSGLRLDVNNLETDLDPALDAFITQKSSGYGDWKLSQGTVPICKGPFPWTMFLPAMTRSMYGVSTPLLKG